MKESMQISLSFFSSFSFYFLLLETTRERGRDRENGDNTRSTDGGSDGVDDDDNVSWRELDRVPT